ncbi:hypothetical protein PUNSTDRAFT_95790 [Punctularia strigosozonata HHB-11173 SS5]|uniref:uncharacterized protein n=1 Tax=Punctularia strigosozonata (strain HHB-11173) TaxID=741275 RepID=UPI0004418471|nr:uncharacterized protein PUNSTDRAFT_95790 [Punctularia strigosozonata HHB-11173 SS5]EIN14163.1 hypothetical protein PUNSTDRAFT_95790 [Punctularia strigosozonata HHB-11173 SS5]
MLFTASAAIVGLAWAASGVQAATHDVTVGGADGTLAFNPEAIFANPGDQVIFHFEQKNHTVTQSSFANPCALKDGGFDSGFMPVPANQTDNFPTYTITVTDSSPIWVFCDQAANTANSHCGQGMVFAVNCGADGSANSFTNFKNAALAQGAALKAAASSASATGGYASATDAATDTWTAAYGSATIPPVSAAETVTATVTLASSTWTTTYASYPGSAEPTPASLEGNVHKIVVGSANGTLAFDPPSIQAAPRDVVVFEFHQKNHTVTQSSFAAPCVHLNNATSGVVGFDSGFMPVAPDATEFPTWNYTVVDTSPVWAYCRQKTPVSHCGMGMVFAINAVESSQRNFDAFQALAKQLNGTNATTSSASGSAASPSATTTTSGALAQFGGNVLATILGALAVASFALL